MRQAPGGTHRPGHPGKSSQPVFRTGAERQTHRRGTGDIHYHVTAHRAGRLQAIDLTAETSPITLGNIAIGTWNITVEALNPNGKIWHRFHNQNVLNRRPLRQTLSLETLPGDGEVSLQSAGRPTRSPLMPICCSR
jgi:hypothetical protein